MKIFESKYIFEKLENIEQLPEPDYVDNYVTDFSCWLYKCTKGKKSKYAMKRGKEKECDIDKNRMSRWGKSNTRKIFDSGWSLLYSDLSKNKAGALKISQLEIRGAAIFGKPDLIYVNDAKKEAYIVEIKFSNKEMPHGGWPNARAQLWLYSKIDDLKKYKKIYLVCESYSEDVNGVLEAQRVIFDADNSDFNKKNMELFAKYKSYETKKPTRLEYERYECESRKKSILKRHNFPDFE